MAIVYKARDVILNRNVAVKVLRDEYTTDQEFIKRFETEAQSAARLTHPNIVSIYDVGVDNGIYYIVMELVQGKTLKEIIIEENGPLPWKWSINVAIQIASALDTAHCNNIVHRDIKPHNIIITEDGVAKITDFGIAKAVSNSTITAFGTTMGSVHYFSPEHARGGYTDAKSDIYSLGVVMYEMLTGQVPFDADTPVSVALKHMQEDPIEPIEINPNIPEAINQIIMKAIQKDPMLRYQTSIDLERDLKEALKNPNGDFVEKKSYDRTARTQKISTEQYANNRDRGKKQQGKFKQWITDHKKLSVFLGVILLFFLAFGGTMAVLNITNPPEVDMPNVVGMHRDEAKKAIEDAKLVYEEEKEEYNKEVEEDHIISQDPAYFEKYHSVKQGSTVKVVVSLGTEKAVVPNVEGKEKEEAIKLIEEAKLKAEVIEETSKTVQEGHVIKQELDPEAEALAGDVVKIHVSTGTGIKQITMSNVVGKPEASAKSELEGLGFRVSISYEENSSKDNGTVLKQSLESGKVADEGTTVTLTVNKIQEDKTATVTINVKSLTGGYTNNANAVDTTNGTDTNSAGTSSSTTDKTVDVQVLVNDQSIYTSSGVDKNKTDLSTQISGKGTVTVKVLLTDKSGGNWTRTQSVNLNNSSRVSFQ